jgi:hypothetical protein
MSLCECVASLSGRLIKGSWIFICLGLSVITVYFNTHRLRSVSVSLLAAGVISGGIWTGPFPSASLSQSQWGRLDVSTTAAKGSKRRAAWPVRDTGLFSLRRFLALIHTPFTQMQRWKLKSGRRRLFPRPFYFTIVASTLRSLSYQTVAN